MFSRQDLPESALTWVNISPIPRGYRGAAARSAFELSRISGVPARYKGYAAIGLDHARQF